MSQKLSLANSTKMMILLEGTVCPAIILCPCLLARVSNAVRRSLPPSVGRRADTLKQCPDDEPRDRFLRTSIAAQVN